MKSIHGKFIIKSKIYLGSTIQYQVKIKDGPVILINANNSKILYFLDFDSKEEILLLGLQYNFTNDIYFSLQTNQIEIDDRTSDISQLSLSRIYFMFIV